MSWTSAWRVEIDGNDISLDLSPRLISISVVDKDGATADSCSITVDDTDGAIRLPRVGAKILVHFKGVEVFRGRLDAPKSTGDKSSARKLQISAKSMANAEKAKEPQVMFADDQTLGDFLGSVAEHAGFEISIDDEMKSIKRDYWNVDGQSFQSFGEQLAGELNGTFKIKDDKAVLAKRGTGKSPSGQTLPTIYARHGDNLHSWDATPMQPRPTHGKTKVQFFDRAAGEVKTETVEHDGADTGVARMIKTLAADKEQAKAIGEARGGEQEREKGGGTVTIDPDPAAQVEAPLKIRGARTGVDGTYRITEVKHSGSKGAGNITTLKFKEPKGGAGVDGR